MKFKEENSCTPDILERESKHHSADYNCNNCEQTDCVYWQIYNEPHIKDELTNEIF